VARKSAAASRNISLWQFYAFYGGTDFSSLPSCKWFTNFQLITRRLTTSSERRHGHVAPVRDKLSAYFIDRYINTNTIYSTWHEGVSFWFLSNVHVYFRNSVIFFVCECVPVSSVLNWYEKCQERDRFAEKWTIRHELVFRKLTEEISSKSLSCERGIWQMKNVFAAFSQMVRPCVASKFISTDGATMPTNPIPGILANTETEIISLESIISHYIIGLM